MGLPPTGKAFQFSIVHLLTVRDHQIVHERRVYDFTGFLLSIGALKVKPA
jgi:predicted ester cyclase